MREPHPADDDPRGGDHRRRDGSEETDTEAAPATDGRRASFSRRTLLRTGATVGAATGLAGCSFGLPDVTSYSFDAAPAVLAASENGPTYELRTMLEDTVERTPTVLGTEMDVEITSQAAVYDGDEDTLGLLSSPTATVAGRTQNPLATKSLREILVGPEGDRLLSALDLVEADSATWRRGPRVVATGQGELLGTTTDVDAFAGVTEESGFVLLTAARVTDAGDVVFAATGQQRRGEASDLVGSSGYVDSGTVSGSVARLETNLSRVQRGGAGARVIEAAQIEPDGDGPDYIRALLANQYDDRTLHSVQVAAQLFDAQGGLLVVETAGVAALAPDEEFEAYVPYVAADVAGYAVEVDHSSRQITTAPTANATVTDKGRDGDTASVAVRNTAGEKIPFVSLEVAFYDEDGSVLSRESRAVANLAGGERREYDVVYAPSGFDSPATVADHSVELLEYTGDARYVR